MPIVDIEIVAGERGASIPDKRRLQRLTDELGDVFRSEPANTWVRLRSLDETAYAENRSAEPEAVLPVFVNVLKAHLPNASAMRREMAEIAEAVARLLERPVENVHVVYAPGASGRIGFGGELTE